MVYKMDGKLTGGKDSSGSSLGLKNQPMFSCSLLVVFLGGQFRGWCCLMPSLMTRTMR